MKISNRSKTRPFIAMDVLSRVAGLEAEGRDIIHMEVGEPAYGAPNAAYDALAAARGEGTTFGYTSGLGILPLRKAIAALYQRRYGIDLDPGRVIVTAGSSAGFMLSFLGCFDAGERLAIADPGYPCYRNIIDALGLEAVRIETGVETKFQPTLAHLEAAGQVDGLLVASPANPTGSMLTGPELEALVSYARQQEIVLISDEIYHGLTYEEPGVTALAFSDDVVVINSFSKYYAMTGWRIGWMIVPEALVRIMQNLAQNLFICPSHASQVAALGALSPEGEAEVGTHIGDYRRNRDLVTETLSRLGFCDMAPSDGAFYAYASLPEGFDDAALFCDRLLTEGGVAATPGLDFDTERGRGTVRFSFAQSPEKIAEGMARLTRWLEAARV